MLYNNNKKKKKRKKKKNIKVPVRVLGACVFFVIVDFLKFSLLVKLSPVFRRTS